MGNGTSLPKVEGFSAEEVSRLEKRFQKLDLDHSGSISVGEFLSVPELKENPLVKRVVDVFDSDLSGEVDFKGKSKYCFITYHYHLVILRQEFGILEKKIIYFISCSMCTFLKIAYFIKCTVCSTTGFMLFVPSSSILEKCPNFIVFHLQYIVVIFLLEDICKFTNFAFHILSLQCAKYHCYL